MKAHSNERVHVAKSSLPTCFCFLLIWFTADMYNAGILGEEIRRQQAARVLGYLNFAHLLPDQDFCELTVILVMFNLAFDDESQQKLFPSSENKNRLPVYLRLSKQRFPIQLRSVLRRNFALFCLKFQKVFLWCDANEWVLYRKTVRFLKSVKCVKPH